MSDAPETRRGGTAPLPITAQPAGGPSPAPAPAPAAPAAPARPATQVSASAVPSTLDSPQEPGRTDGSLRHDVTTQDDGARVAAERDAAFAVAGIAGAPAPAPLAHDPAQDPGRRGAPPTLMSPAVPAPGDRPASPSLAPEDAVVDVGAPAHAFLPPAGSPGYGGPLVRAGVMPAGAHVAGAAHGPGARRSMSTTFLVMVVVGGFAGLVLLAGVVVGFFYLAERRKAEAAAAEGRALHAPAVTVAPATQEAPHTPPRFGGAKARLAVTSGGAMDPEAVRASLAGVLPRIDACFSAAELEPPNHESVAYDLDVQPSGEVKRVELGTTSGRAPKLDACVVPILRGTRLPRSARASVVKLTFSDPLDAR